LENVTARNFGLLVAYLIPGFVALWGVSFHAEPVRVWLLGAASHGATVGGFLYVTLASVAAGMTASAIRWAILDSLHRVTGIRRPRWNDTALENKLTAFEYVVEQHYRYYQFYGNGLVGLLFAYGAWFASDAHAGRVLGAVDLGVLGIAIVFYAGSRDALRKYYRRASILLGDKESEESDDERKSPSNGSGTCNGDEAGAGAQSEEQQRTRGEQANEGWKRKRSGNAKACP